MLKPAIVEVQPSMFKDGVEETFTPPSATSKSLQRLAIQEQVFDNSDAIADNAKMISLLISVVSRIYDAMPAAQKDLISAADRTMIEYTFEQFALIQTRADVQFAIEGLALIDKLLARQSQIGSIVS